MKIHFCDLCNESVPQTDLDEERAFIRKGRVVCATCDRSMSHEEQAGGPVGGPFGAGAPASGAPAPSFAGPSAAAPAGTSAGTSAGAPAGAPPSAPPPPAPAAPAPLSPPVPHHTYGSHRPRSSGAGVGVGLVALLLASASAFWAYDRTEKLNEDLRAAHETLRDDLRLNDQRIGADLRSQAEESRQVADALRRELSDQRAWLDGRLARADDQAKEVSAKLDTFGATIGEMREAFGEVNRHDQELMRLQKRYTALGDEVHLLGVRIDELLARPTAPAAGAGAAPPDPGEAPPPWMGLVEQLASENTSERWQAVVALGETNDPAVSEYLLPALQDTDIFIRMVTARVLGDLGSPKCIPALIEALDDEESAVREAAYIALRAVTQRDLPFDPVTEDASQRARRIKAWRDWWDKEKDRFQGT
jgi:hypothetical protein